MTVAKELPAVAQRVFWACKKCAVDRYQTVMAHTTSKSAKLECEVCKTKNTMKLAPAKKASKPKKAKTSSTVTPWDDVKSLLNEREKKSYTMKAGFSKDMTIEHPKFGLGVVVATQAHSIEVVFVDGTRSLVHNRL